MPQASHHPPSPLICSWSSAWQVKTAWTQKHEALLRSIGTEEPQGESHVYHRPEEHPSCQRKMRASHIDFLEWK